MVFYKYVGLVIVLYLVTLSSCNIVLFGNTGAGKSSLINAMTGSTTLATSDSSYSVTAMSKSVDCGGVKFWDTMGLDDNSQDSRDDGFTGTTRALLQLFGSIQKEGGVKALVLVLECPNPRVPHSLQSTVELIKKVLGKYDVPIILHWNKCIDGSCKQCTDSFEKNKKNYQRQLGNPEVVVFTPRKKGCEDFDSKCIDGVRLLNFYKNFAKEHKLKQIALPPNWEEIIKMKDPQLLQQQVNEATCKLHKANLDNIQIQIDGIRCSEDSCDGDYQSGCRRRLTIEGNSFFWGLWKSASTVEEHIDWDCVNWHQEECRSRARQRAEQFKNERREPLRNKLIEAQRQFDKLCSNQRYPPGPTSHIQ
eukprot:TRINITY_DN659_c0_g1_i1.p1 TRINITY_DN659_c0_g1~~TRINITY_DN659_c0_g1_i1.p1  ORF type:complete len:363 (-),score=49.90 TRINITY_DN659_c0_g1_i1:36-1124(-)